MGNTHSGKRQKSLEKPGFPGIPRKFSSLIYKLIKRQKCVRFKAMALQFRELNFLMDPINTVQNTGV
jgi:hypothetical protein